MYNGPQGGVIVLLATSGVGCSLNLSDRSFPSSVTTEQESPVPFPTEMAITTSLLLPTLTLTPTWLLSIGGPTTAISEALATAMVATHPYFTELLYYPNPQGLTVEGELTETVINLELSWQSDFVTNTAGTLRAFTACDPDLCHERIFVEYLDTGQTYEFWFSTRMNWRPISQLRWLDDDILLFDQWSQPHYGFEFAVDVQQRRLLLYLIVVDECFVYGICG